MSIITKASAKNYFLTGAFPTQSQFADTIDSYLGLGEIGSQTIGGPVVVSASLGVIGVTSHTGKVSAKGGLNTTIISANSLNVTGDVHAFTGKVTASAASFSNIVSANIVNTATVSAANTYSDNIFTTTASAADSSTRVANTSFVQTNFPLVTTGSWTPVLTFVTPGDLSVAYTTQAGWYIKIGRLVIAAFNIVTSTFTHTTSSGQCRITGLPFSASFPATNTADAISYLSYQGITKASYTSFLADITNGTNYVAIAANGSGQVNTSVQSSDMPTSGTVILEATCYYTAAS